MRWVSYCALGVATAALLIGVAFAETAPPGAFDVLFKNTIKITWSAGEEYVYFNPDKTFMTRGPDGDTYGEWSVDGDKICTTVKGAAESCGLIEANRTVGDHWQHQLNGETVTIEIVKGR